MSVFEKVTEIEYVFQPGASFTNICTDLRFAYQQQNKQPKVIDIFIIIYYININIFIIIKLVYGMAC